MALREQTKLMERYVALRQQEQQQPQQPQQQPQQPQPQQPQPQPPQQPQQPQQQPQQPQPQQQQPQQPSALVPQAVKVERVVVAQPSPRPTMRALDREEIAILYDRSQALVGQGDIASARLMLIRAAEAGDARAALALGATYDPDVLKKLGVLGVAADPAQAHAWYTKAVELGSPEASLRLERLAQATR
jgi:TPR repeat protein